MDLKIDVAAIKALSKEQRQGLAQVIKRDPELWNAVNGIGGLSEKSEKGLLTGDTTYLRTPLPNVNINIRNKAGIEKNLKSNQYGFYKIELAPDLYTVIFSYGAVQSLPKDVQVAGGNTYVAGYDFDKIQ